jgi:CHAD domain-containing protein
MAYRWEREEPLDEAARRVAREQIARALEEIESAEIDRETAVHQVRKRCKKIRALLRLVRDASPQLYRRENRSLRDTARALSAARDADVLIETFDGLASSAEDEVGGETRARLREVLTQHRSSVVPTARELDERIREVERSLLAAEARVDTWALPNDGFSTAGKGLNRTYRRARRAMGAALGTAGTEQLHEWRKRTKYHRYQVRLLQPLWEPVLDARRAELHRLTDLLGEDHDLAVLRDVLLAKGGGGDPLSGLAAFVEVLDEKRAELQSAMPGLGRRLFAEKPETFVQRIARYAEADAVAG